MYTVHMYMYILLSVCVVKMKPLRNALQNQHLFIKSFKEVKMGN